MSVGSLWLLHLRGSLILTVPSQSCDSVMSWPWNGKQYTDLDKKHIMFESTPLFLTSTLLPSWLLTISIHNHLQQHVIPCHPCPHLPHWCWCQEGKNHGGDHNHSWSGVHWRDVDPRRQGRVGAGAGDVDGAMGPQTGMWWCPLDKLRTNWITGSVAGEPPKC